jgi:hypothetical protein|uniref:Uncharacterized protein n=1 Tax=viral metagenome TaxID=1070528 RepID=A0A6C0C2A6_9ZZZZ
MHLIEDIWGLIKSYMFHNIKIHGKHLKNDPDITKYNQVMDCIPKPSVPINGPRIIYSSMTNSVRFIKFVYHFNFFFKKHQPYNYYLHSRTIIEVQMLKDGYDGEYLTRDSKFREEYFNQYK